MPDKPDKKYMCDLLNALNDEVDPDEWGHFSIDTEDPSVWCVIAYPSRHPDMKLRFSSIKDRVSVATASFPTRIHNERYVRASKITDYICTFAASRPFYQCAREIVRKVLSPWLPEWARMKAEVDELVENINSLDNVRERIAKALRIKVLPKQKGASLRHYPDSNKIGTVEADVGLDSVSLKLRGLPADVAEKVLEYLNGLIPLK